MKKNTSYVAIIGLAIGAIFGLSGMFFTDPATQLILFMISGLGLIVGNFLLCIKFAGEQNEFAATGFLLIGTGEAIMTGGAGADPITGEATFATGILLYVVGFLLIGLQHRFPLWVRISGLAAAIPFLIAGSRKFLGYGLSSADMLPGMGYGLFVVTIIGWIIYLIKETRAVSPG